MKEITIQEERLGKEEYIGFLAHSDLGSQYPRERFEQRIGRLVENVPISLTARDGDRIVGVCFGITDFAYWLFITDLGVDREYVRRGIGAGLLRTAHRLAGGERDIILYTCVNEDAIPFYEKCGFKPSDDVMQRSEGFEWTAFTVGDGR